jgi:hypothetical protein
MTGHDTQVRLQEPGQPGAGSWRSWRELRQDGR